MCQRVVNKVCRREAHVKQYALHGVDIYTQCPNNIPTRVRNMARVTIRRRGNHILMCWGRKALEVRKC